MNRALLIAGLVGCVVTPGASAAAPILDGFGGPADVGVSIASTDLFFDVSDVFPAGLRLYRVDTSTELGVGINGMVALGRSTCCYLGLPLPQADVGDFFTAPAIHGFEFGSSLGQFDGDDLPLYMHRIPADDVAPARLITTWFQFPDRGLDDPRVRFNTFQLVLTAVGDNGDFDVEFRHVLCGFGARADRPNDLAVVGFDARLGADGPGWMWPGSLTADTRRMCELSNVREPGVFRYQVRDGIPQGCGIGLFLPEGGDGGERCADGNHLPGDGCSPACYVEPDVDHDGRFEAPHPDARLIDPYEVYDDCVDDRPECNDDPDGDGIPSNIDNCPEAANPEQYDQDGDGAGNPCDFDADGDGLLGPKEAKELGEPADNCPFIYNPGFRRVDPDVFIFRQQIDSDRDEKGDLCDDDDDNDGVLDCGLDEICDPLDNANDEDRDGRADEAGECAPPPPDDPDFFFPEECQNGRTDYYDNDQDGAIDEAHEREYPPQPYPGPDPDGSEDNCRRIPNADQADFDLDGIGDVCDPDIDGDGIPNCTLNGLCGPQHDLRDNDLDGIADEVGECIFEPCDIDADWLDQDLDGYTDEGFEVPAEGWPPTPIDNCPWWPSDDLSDRNDDGIGDACADDDGDGLPAYLDNCPDIANENQRNIDRDLAGDVCDSDRDGDGRDNDIDGCPDVPDDGADLDGDGQGDACDTTGAGHWVT